MANFKLVPVHYQLLVVNMVTILGACHVAAQPSPHYHKPGTTVSDALRLSALTAATAAAALLSSADSCFMSWARANDGWFPRLFPVLAARLGMEALPAVSTASGAAGKKPTAAAAAARQPAAASSAKPSR